MCVLFHGVEQVVRDFYDLIERPVATRLVRGGFLRASEDIPCLVWYFARQSLDPEAVGRVAGDLNLVAVDVDLLRLCGLFLSPRFAVSIGGVLPFATCRRTSSFSRLGRRRLLLPHLTFLVLKRGRRLAAIIIFRATQTPGSSFLTVFTSLGLPLDRRLSVQSEVVVGAVAALFSRLFSGGSPCWPSGGMMACSAGAVTVTSAHCGAGRFLTSAIAKLLYGRRLKPATVVVGTVEGLRWLLRSAGIRSAGRVFGRAGAVGFRGSRVVIASRGVLHSGRSIGAHW